MTELKVITYKEERLAFFADQRKATQKRYNRLKKLITPDEPYMSENRQFLSDCGRELSFYDDIIKMLEDDMRAPKEIKSAQRSARWKPHYYISQGSSPMAGKYEDGWTCSYCGKYSCTRKEVCDGCNSIMYEKVIR